MRVIVIQTLSGNQLAIVNSLEHLDDITFYEVLQDGQVVNGSTFREMFPELNGAFDGIMADMLGLMGISMAPPELSAVETLEASANDA